MPKLLIGSELSPASRVAATLTGDKVPMAAADKCNMRHTAILLIVSA